MSRRFDRTANSAVTSRFFTYGRKARDNKKGGGGGGGGGGVEEDEEEDEEEQGERGAQSFARVPTIKYAINGNRVKSSQRKVPARLSCTALEGS